MKDHFQEEVVQKHNRVLDEILYWMSWGVLIFSGFMGLMMLSATLSSIASPNGFDFVTLLLGLFFAACCLLLYLYHDRLRTEYEYALVMGEGMGSAQVDFAQVFNNSKRKNLGSLNLKNIEAYGPVASGAFNRYINTPGVKQKRWFLNRGADLYFFYWKKNDEKNIIIFEPSAEMAKQIRMRVPNGVYQEH